MNCPYCGSTLLEEASNFNEFTCNLCKCEFKHDGDRYRIFEEGNYKKFCDNIMYHLCEKASPKVSNILVSVLSQLKNNGVEEIDTVLEHLQMVASNVSSEMVIGLQTESDLEVVKEGIECFNNLGNTLLKRDDLELDLHRFSRLQEAKAFYEKVYVSAIDSPTVNGFKKGAMEEGSEAQSSEAKKERLKDALSAAFHGDNDVYVNGEMIDIQTALEQAIKGALTADPKVFDNMKKPYLGGNNGNYFEKELIPQLDKASREFPSLKASVEELKSKLTGVQTENTMDGLPEQPIGPSGFEDTGIAPGLEQTPPPELDVPPEDLALAGQPPMGGISDTEIGGPNDPDLQPGGDPSAIAPQDIELAKQQVPFEEELLEKLAEVMAKGYSEGNIAMEADFAEALMNCEEAKGMCENIGSMPEEIVYELAQKVANKLQENPALASLAGAAAGGGGIASGNTVNINTEGDVSEEQLCEAIEILSKAANLTEEELKDL
jgi:hypothetical protein